MKKRILAMLLSGLLLLSATACQTVPENEINTTPSNQHEIEEPPEDLENTKLTVDFQSYDSIISTFRKIVTLSPQYETVKEEEHFVFADTAAYDLYQKLFSSTLALYPRTWNGLDGNCYERFGYTVKDLNSDGVDELILRLDNHQIVAIFTTVNDSPVLLGNFWNRNRCWIDPEGYLHVSGSNGADRSIFRIYRIDEQTGTLLLLEEYGTDGQDEQTGTTLFYRLIDAEKCYLSEQELDSWTSTLPYADFEITNTISTYLPFVSLFDTTHPAPPPYPSQAKG